MQYILKLKGLNIDSADQNELIPNLCFVRLQFSKTFLRHGLLKPKFYVD